MHKVKSYDDNHNAANVIWPRYLYGAACAHTVVILASMNEIKYKRVINNELIEHTLD